MYTGALSANSQGTSGEARGKDAASVYRYTGAYEHRVRSSWMGTSGQVREEDAVSVYGYTGTL